MTGARLLASQADAELLARGGKGDFQWGDTSPYRAVKTDRILQDNEKVTLGGVALQALATPGHTKGATTWTVSVEENGEPVSVVFISSVTAHRLVNNVAYPEILDDYRRSFERLKRLRCDVFLAPHGRFFGLAEKAQQMRAGGCNPFVDTGALQNHVAHWEQLFSQSLKEQEAAARAKKVSF